MNKTTSVFFILVGLLLAAAAILKSLHAVSEGINGSLMAYLAISVGIFLEFCLGAWLVFSKNAWQAKKWFVFALFFAFGVYQCLLARNGEASCGCIGFVEISPVFMLILDFAIASIALTILRVGESDHIDSETASHGKSELRGKAFVASVCAFTIFLVVNLSFMSIPLSLASARSVMENGMPLMKPIIKIDEEIKGKDFDFEAILGSDFDRNLAKGRWTVIFLSPNCSVCDKLKQRFSNFSTDSHLPKTLLINLFADESGRDAVRERYAETTANNSFAWAMSTPFCVEINNGRVMEILDCSTCFTENEQ
ncbi:hypothetical protein N9B31_06670 [Mariniblastus sp.]|nr:hypothetical protein [Mariniblastus sp.]